MHSPVVAVLALCAVWLAGVPAARLLGLRGALFVATSWLYGGVLLSLLMMLASALRVPYTRPALALCWVLALCGPWALGVALGYVPLRTGLRLRSHGRDTPHPLRGYPVSSIDQYCVDRALADHAANSLGNKWGQRAGTATAVAPVLAMRPQSQAPCRALLSALLDLPALLVCLFQVAYVLLQAVRVPLGSFDAWSLWEYKGRRFWQDAGLTGGFLHDHAAIFAHPAYPPLVPLLIAWVYTWLGAADPALMKPIFAAFYASLLLAFYGALRARFPARGALFATAALALLPRVTEYAGTGLADVPLAAALVASAAVLARPQPASDRRALLAAGLLLGVALLVKRDALFFAIAALLALALYAHAWRVALRFALPAGLVALPWYAYVRLTGVPDRDFLPLTPHNLFSHADRLGGIARLFALNTLATDEWSVLWYLFAALLLLGLARRRLRAPVLLLPVLFPLALYVVALSLSAWPDYMLHVRTSLDRLILVTAPFVLWFIVEQMPLPGTPGNSPRTPRGGARP